MGEIIEWTNKNKGATKEEFFKKFRITIDTADTAQNMNLQQAGYTATMPSRS